MGNTINKQLSKGPVRTVLSILVGIVVGIVVTSFVYSIIVTIIFHILLNQVVIMDKVGGNNNYGDILSKIKSSSNAKDKRFFKASGKHILKEFYSDLRFEEGSLQVNENRDVSILFYINFWKWLSKKQQSMKNSTKGAIVYRSINCIEFDIWDEGNKESESIYNYQRSFVQNGGFIYRILVGRDIEQETMDKIKVNMEDKIGTERFKVHCVTESQLKEAKCNDRNLALQDFEYDFLWLRNENICLKWKGVRKINGADLLWVDKKNNDLDIKYIWELAFDAAFQEYQDRTVIPEKYQYDFERTRLRVYQEKTK